MAEKEMPDPRRQALGRAIKTMRTAMGLERRELAKRADISYPYLSQIENGKARDPSTTKLESIAGALGVPLHNLYELVEETPLGPQDGSVAAGAPAGEIRNVVMDRVYGAAKRAPQSALEQHASTKSKQLVELVDLAKSLSQEDLRMLLELARRLHSQQEATQGSG